MPRGSYGKSLATDIATATVEHEGLMTPTQAAMLLNLDARADALALVRAKQSASEIDWEQNAQTLATGTLGAGFWLVWGTARVRVDTPTTADYELGLLLVTEYNAVLTTKFAIYKEVTEGYTGQYITITTPPVAISLMVESDLHLRGAVMGLADPYDHAVTFLDNDFAPRVSVGFQAVRLAETPLE